MKIEDELIRPIPNHEGYYCTWDGDVYSSKRARIFKKISPAKDKDGYFKLTLYYKNKRFYFRSHRVVALTWVLDNQNKTLVVNHKDGNIQNNDFKNLEWITAAENERHARFILGKQISHIDKNAVIDIRYLRNKGMLYRDIAKKHGISKSQARRICIKEQWSHV